MKSIRAPPTVKKPQAPAGPSYPHGEVEALLQAGDLKAALRKGWFGDEWSYRLVRAAAGRTLQRLRVVVEPGTNLGVDLINEDGVATIGLISPSGSVGRDGQLRSGDVIRAVDGQICLTCEAAVQAIKAASRGDGADGAPRRPLVLDAVRPPSIIVWRDEQLQLRAGDYRQVAFETTEPSCLTYCFGAHPGHEYDVTLSAVRLVGSARARRSGYESQEQILMVREVRGRGHVVLTEPGRYAFAFDNQHSLFRAKRLRYLLRCVPLDAWEAGRQVERLAELETEVASRRARGKELTAQIGGLEARLGTLRAELASVEATADAARQEKEANKASLNAAKKERDELSEALRGEMLSNGTAGASTEVS